MSQPKRVFFTYPHADRTFATRLAKSLQEEGLELDRVDSSEPAVRNGIEQLEKRVLSAGSVVLLINPRSKFDEEQQRIWQAILGAAWEDRKLLILPVLLRDAELPPFVRSAAAGDDVQAIRVQDSSDLGSITQAILENLRFKRAQPILRTRSANSLSSGEASFEERPGTGSSRGKMAGSASAGEASVTFEIYPSSREAARKERLERVADLQEYIEQLKR